MDPGEEETKHTGQAIEIPQETKSNHEGLKPRRKRKVTRKAILDMVKSHHITVEEG